MAGHGPAGFNDGLGMAQSYYVATANPFEPAPTLADEIEADVCVVGGGVTGLSAALHARERGFSVVLLEGGLIGWGASGRNGGQMIPGLRKGAAELIERYGLAKARRLFELAMEARAVTLDLIARHAIACDLKNTGHLLLAAKPRDVSDLQREADALAGPMGYAQARLLSAQDARAEVAAANYHGALLDERGGHLHPLNYTLGLAEAARKAGVQVFESSRVTSIESEKGFRAKTAHGAVRAKFGVLACDAFAGEADPRFIGAVMPVANYICATAPLPDPRAVIAQDRAVSDSRFVVNYFRLSADGRMLFGGGERYSPRAPADMAGFVRGHMGRVFPQLAQTPIDYAWGGLVSITSSRLPHFGRRGDMVFAHGYSGQGVLLSALAGKLMAEALTGVAEKFDLFASVAPTPFPGGAGLRDPLYVLGMLYYALRDRL